MSREDLTTQEDRELEDWVDDLFNEAPLQPLPEGFLARTMSEVRPVVAEPFRIGWIEIVSGLSVALSGTVFLNFLRLGFLGHWPTIFEILTTPRLVTNESTLTFITYVSVGIGLSFLLLLLPRDKGLSGYLRLSEKT